MRKFLFLSFMLMLAGLTSWAQRTVSGRVTDANGNPVPNASVQVQNTQVGTVTREDGTFSLTVPANGRVLLVSAVGLTRQEVSIGTQTNLSVSLNAAAEPNLQEVVVTAFGIRRDKKSLGYGVTQLQPEQVTMAHTTNITNALAGKVPGVRVSGSGGSFSGSSIIIRGYSTFTGTNQPLFVIDGVPIDNSGGGTALQNGAVSSNRAIDINQDDIETMTVLKGPSAAALYGSRASNGAILITTKKGRAGRKASIQFSTTYQTEKVNRLPDYQNQYGQGLGGAFNGLTNSSWGPEAKGQPVNQYNPATNAFDRSAPFLTYPDNVSDIFQTGTNLQNNISFSGGTDRNTYRLSYGYLRNEGIIANNLLNRHNLTFNASSKVTERLTASVAGTYTNNFSKRTQQGNQLSNPFFRGWFIPRSYDLTGLAFENAIGDQRYPMGEDNPYWTIKHNRFNDEINRLYGNIGFNYRIANGIQADYKLGTDLYSTFNHGYDQIGARGGANTTANGAGGVVERRNEFRSFNSNFFVTITKRVANFNVTGIVGNEISQSYNRTATMIGRTVLIRDFEQISNTSAIATPAVGSTKFRLIGVYGDLTIAYKSIASINGTLRSDWASTFTIGNNQYLYPSVAASVNFTELFPSIKGDVIDNIKIRGNISKVGKAGTDFIYGTDSYFGAPAVGDGFGPIINFPFNGLQAFTLSATAGNANLGPEFTTNREIGLELSFFRNRLTIEATRYKQQSTDLIFAVPVSATAGITAVLQNIGDMSTKGFELGISGSPIRSRAFNWDINANYTQFKSMVDRLAPGVTNIFLGGFTTPNIRLVAGDEYGQIYGNAYQRDPKNGNKIIVGANGLPLITSGVQKIGNPNPEFLIGVTNTFSAKGFSLSILLDWKKGGDQYSRNIADLRRNGAVIETAKFARFDATATATKPYLFDGVYASGQPNTTYVTAEQYWGNSGVFAAAEGFILETTWLRVREASLSYRLPSSLLEKTMFGSAEFSLFGRNLFLHAPNYPHLDPEQNALGANAQGAQGLEFNGLPQTRTIGVGLKFGF